VEFIIISFIVYIIIDLYKLYKRNKYISTTLYTVDIFQRVVFRLGLRDLVLLSGLLSTVALAEKLKDYTFFWMLIPFIYIEVREKFKSSTNIVFYNDGMSFENTHILWRDIQDFKKSGRHTLIIKSYNPNWNRFVVSNVESVEKLEAMIVSAMS